MQLRDAWYYLWIGLLIGAVIATATSSAIALSMFATDCPWPILWKTWGKLLVLTVPTCSATVATVLLIKHAVPKEVNGMPAAPPVRKREEVINTAVNETAEDPLTLGEKIVCAAYEQAKFYYTTGRNPTRRLFEQEMGMSQAFWSSARDLLLAADIVNDSNDWAGETWTVIEAVIDRMRTDDPDRIWLRPLNSRNMFSIPVSEQLVGNRYTITDKE